MRNLFRRLLAAVLCLSLLAVPALAAEATLHADYVEIVGEGFVADTFCGVDALYNETGNTLFCNELIVPPLPQAASQNRHSSTPSAM